VTIGMPVELFFAHFDDGLCCRSSVRRGSDERSHANQDAALGSVAVGDVLPDLRIAVTATEIVAGAIATRDFMPVHHDRAYANAQGAPDVFMNILSDTGYCGRFLTDWAGPEAMLKRLAIRLGCRCSRLDANLQRYGHRQVRAGGAGWWT
jgi:hypothetical protein